MSIKLELKNFKHVSSDDNSTTLQHHKDGHTIILAHKALSSKNKEQLKALQAASESVKPAETSIKEEPRQKLAYGTPTNTQQDESRIPSPDMPMPDYANDPNNIVQTVPSAQAAEQMIPMFQAGDAQAAGTSPVATRAQPASTGMEPNAQEQQQAQSLAGAAQPLTDSLAPSGLDQLNQGIRQFSSGEKEYAKAQGNLGGKEAEIQQDYQEALKNQQSAQFHAEKSIQDKVATSTQAVAEAKIDPEKYWTGDKDGNGSHSRWLSAIGMILAGFDPAGRPNMAVQVLQHQMDANLQSQRDNLGTKKTLLEANIKELKDVRDGALLTRLQLNDLTQHQLAQAAAASQSPLAAAAAQKAIGQLKISQAQEYDALVASQAQKNLKAQLAASISGQNSSVRQETPASYVPYLVPKEHQKDVFEEIKKAEDTKKISGELRQLFKDSAKENTIARTGFGLREPGSVMGMKALIISQMKDLDATSREFALKEAEKNLIPANGDSEHKIQQKSTNLEDWLNSRQSAPTAKAYGIDLSKFQSTSVPQRANPNEGKTAVNKQGDKIVMKNGQWVSVSGK